MVDQKKVKLMTEMAVYERTSKITIKHNKYFEKKYKYVIALRSIVTGLAIGVLVTFLIFAAKYEAMLDLYSRYGIAFPVTAAVICVMIVAAVYVSASVLILGRKFENMRGGYVKYKLCRQELSKLENEE